jgi:hypothetical protein
MREPYLPKIADTGNAKQLDESGKTDSVFFEGMDPNKFEHFYCPPELVQNVCALLLYMLRGTSGEIAEATRPGRGHMGLGDDYVSALLPG